MSIQAIEAPAELDITIVVGDSFNRNVELVDGDGIAIDLTGYAARAQVYTVELDEILVEFSVASLGSDGVIPLLIRSTDTVALLDIDRALWSLTLISNVNPTTDTTTLIRGHVLVQRSGMSLV